MAAMTEDAVEGGAPNRRARDGLFAKTLVLCGIALLTFTLSLYVLDPPMPVAAHFFRGEDVHVLLGVSLLLLGFAAWRGGLSWPAFATRLPMRVGFALALLAAAAAVTGAVFALGQFDLVRDEIDANFDAAIFRSGRLLAPLAEEWRPYLGAFLGPAFVLPVPGDVAWASSYLPGNAALRALFGATIGAQWTNPLLLALAMVSLFGVARRLWPGRPDAALVAGLLLATSSQALVNAMTSYSMTAHLAFNLLWLWLFLRDDGSSHALAILVGFIACGLHQVVFHPIFVAPFILALFFSGRRRLFFAYVAAYAVICLFWVEYFALAQWLMGIQKQEPDEAGAGVLFILWRLAGLLGNIDIGALFLMLGNLARFFAWQNPIALPLAVLSIGALCRGEGVARPLAAGVALSLVVFGLLMPQQGNGWGYRYLHGFLGSWSLLAAYGWIALTRERAEAERRAAVAVFAAAAALALLALAPLRVWQVAASERPYRAAVDLMRSAGADVVLIDRAHLMHGGGLTRNDPFLSRKPIMLDLIYIDEARLAELCARHTVSILSERRALALGIPYYATAKKWDELREKKLAALNAAGCAKEL